MENFLSVYLRLYRLVLCFVTVFLTKFSYELRSVNALIITDTDFQGTDNWM